VRGCVRRVRGRDRACRCAAHRGGRGDGDESIREDEPVVEHEQLVAEDESRREVVEVVRVVVLQDGEGGREGSHHFAPRREGGCHPNARGARVVWR